MMSCSHFESCCACIHRPSCLNLYLEEDIGARPHGRIDAILEVYMDHI